MGFKCGAGVEDQYQRLCPTTDERYTSSWDQPAIVKRRRCSSVSKVLMFLREHLRMELSTFL